MTYRMCAPCLLGVEGIIARELSLLGYENVTAENGRVLFDADDAGIYRANIWLRSAERVLIQVGSFEARSFTELFDNVKALPWEDFLAKDAAFPVKGHSVASKLFSMPDCQKIIKKAVVERLKEKYHIERFPETGVKYQLQYAIIRDVACIYIDTTGSGLHKRGYRPQSSEAPLKETLASAMLQIARYDGFRPLHDPFCGSGTIPIEAALLAQNRAPGMGRDFSCSAFEFLDRQEEGREKERAASLVKNERFEITGADIDPQLVELSRHNAEAAGVGDTVRFETADATKANFTAKSKLVTNPPYGQRLMEVEEVHRLYSRFGENYRRSGCSLYLISSDEELEKHLGILCDKKRKLYNGMIKCNIFMYYRSDLSAPPAAAQGRPQGRPQKRK